jgi:hypothetical protein
MGAMSEPIRSQLPNENYRHGWDETFGRKDKESFQDWYRNRLCDPKLVGPPKNPIEGEWIPGVTGETLDESDFAPRDKEERGND